MGYSERSGDRWRIDTSGRPAQLHARGPRCGAPPVPVPSQPRPWLRSGDPRARRSPYTGQLPGSGVPASSAVPRGRLAKWPLRADASRRRAHRGYRCVPRRPRAVLRQGDAELTAAVRQHSMPLSRPVLPTQKVAKRVRLWYRALGAVSVRVWHHMSRGGPTRCGHHRPGAPDTVHAGCAQGTGNAGPL